MASVRNPLLVRYITEFTGSTHDLIFDVVLLSVVVYLCSFVNARFLAFVPEYVPTANLAPHPSNSPNIIASLPRTLLGSCSPDGMLLWTIE